MSKVRCNVCISENNSFCAKKNTKVKINKSRICKLYVFDETKVKERKQIDSILFGFKEQMLAKKHRRKERIKERESVKEALDNYNKGSQFTSAKHPLTGDLSRFKTTIGKD